MKVTLKQVASLAGVSIKTVSRAINEQGEISDSTRQHVLETIERLGYRPNRLARGLITGKTNAIGIIIPEITDPFFPEFILGAENLARQRHYNVFLCNSNRDPQLELDYVALLSERQVDGLLIAGSMLDQASLDSATFDQKVVILSPYQIKSGITFTINDYESGHAVGQHLISLGHHRIGFFDGVWSRGAKLRQAGLRKAMEEAGIETSCLVIGSVERVLSEKVKQSMLELFQRGLDFTALFCYNDAVAIGVLEACALVNKQVPHDLSLVGYDDIPEAARSKPSLTTIHIDRYDLGRSMMGKLLDLIETNDGQGERIIISGNLIIRESTAKCNLPVPS
jgi:LacI family transcriptional regulator